MEVTVAAAGRPFVAPPGWGHGLAGSVVHGPSGGYPQGDRASLPQPEDPR
jgi:hypothetical protein